MQTSTDNAPNGGDRVCPTCGHVISVEFCEPTGDATCPSCGSLVWRNRIGKRRHSNRPINTSAGSRRGLAAVYGQDWRSAVREFRSCVKLAPDLLIHRASLRGAEYRLYADNGIGHRLSMWLLPPLRALIAESRYSRDWDAVDRLAENGLEFNPWDVEMTVAVGDACEARGFTDSAVYFLTDALRLNESRNDLRGRLHTLAPDDPRFR